MKRNAILLATMIMLAVLSIPADAQVNKKQIGPVVIEGYSDLTITKDKVTISGPRVYMHTEDSKFEAKAQKIVVQFNTGGSAGGVGSLRTAELTGDVWMLSKPEQGKSTETRAEKADVDWAVKRQAVLTGGVKITSIDPTMFSGPLDATADKATISLKRESELRPGEARVRLESAPEKSKIMFTPLPPTESEQG